LDEKRKRGERYGSELNAAEPLQLGDELVGQSAP
jgi:hypothetical protein